MINQLNYKNQKFLEPDEIRKNIKDCFDIIQEYENTINQDETNYDYSAIRPAIFQMKNILSELREYAEEIIEHKQDDIAVYNALALDVTNRKAELFLVLEGIRKTI